MLKMRIESAPTACKLSMMPAASDFLTSADTANHPVSSSEETVGLRLPGVIWRALSRLLFSTLYWIIWYLVAVCQPSMRFLIVSTIVECSAFLFLISTACVSMIFSTISSPAARIVVPVSTKSTTPSASPRPHAASTLPLTNLILVLPVASVSNCLKNFSATSGNEVTILCPARCFAESKPSVTGPCTASTHLPNPNSISTTRSSLSGSVSAMTSNPVIPMSTLPSPT
mmetsp:Transcript_130957/g.195123  ORF Transcript_130957/g.195123 Transcript_130957/m.195123 type:complete len:228 (+) Transcript_130957:151-834(+)